MGLGATPTNSFRNTRLRISDLSLASSSIATSSSCSNQWQQKYTNLESHVQTTFGALKAYMIKEGKIPNELAVFFDPQPQMSMSLLWVQEDHLVPTTFSVFMMFFRMKLYLVYYGF